MEKTFYSNGKLLITGEYLVLKGARALALPTKFGQSLTVKVAGDRKVNWVSHDADGRIWYEDSVSISSIVSNVKSDEKENVRNSLVKILHEAHLMNSSVLDGADGFTIETKLSFPRNWGLGTSSTLINNIAQWFEIDAFELLKRSFGGSGYDIACAQTNSGLIYQLVNGNPTVEEINFKPVLTDYIYFVYLNKKQDSRKEIASFYNKLQSFAEEISLISQITDQVVNENSLNNFCTLLHQHELIISSIINQPTAKESLFPDFDGMIKSLGAWGGDFIMAVSPENPANYFSEKGYDIVIPYDGMIL